MELHVWSPLPGAPSATPACVAAVWLATKSKKEITIKYSSAPYLAPAGAQLPLLITNSGAKISGLVEIAVELGAEISVKDGELATLAWVQQLEPIVLWTLVLLEENAHEVTYPEIKQNTTFVGGQLSVSMLAEHALSAQPPTESHHGPALMEGVNKLHSTMLEWNAKGAQQKQQMKDQMRQITRFTEITNVLKSRTLNEGSLPELLLSASLLLLSLAKLPEAPLRSVIEGDLDLKRCRDLGRVRNVKVPAATPTYVNPPAMVLLGRFF